MEGKNEEGPVTTAFVGESPGEGKGGGMPHPTDGMMPLPGRPVPGKFDEKAHIARQYRKARGVLMEAMKMLDLYEEMGIKPCDISVIHANIRASFGYGN